MPSKPAYSCHKAFPGGVLGHVEKWEKHWRLLSALNKLRISGDIASFVVILRKQAAVPSEQQAAPHRRVMELPDV
jgi:hypothetical protein